MRQKVVVLGSCCQCAPQRASWLLRITLRGAGINGSDGAGSAEFVKYPGQEFERFTGIILTKVDYNIASVCMKANPHFFVYGTVVLLSCLGGVRSFAFLVVEKFGAVSIEQTASGQQTCETGAGGRAQLDLDGGSVIRLGANSTLSSNGADAPASLLKGAAVFDFGTRSRPLLLQHAGKQVTLSSGTGFARFAEGESGRGSVLLVGALANKITVAIDGQSRGLQPGELLALDVQGKSISSDFNLAKVADSASLLKDFGSSLPRQDAIQREVKNFVSLQRRGFVRSNGRASTEQLLAYNNALPTTALFFALAAPNTSSICHSII